MEWVTDMEEIDKQLEKRLRHKTKAAAWFVSRCDSKTDRNVFVRNLQKHLNKYNLTVDVYGKCGSLQCPRSQSDVCDAMLEKDYYFYLALENSFDEDYVTEKVLRAMQNNVVPIVYGGANYSRFLPPGSYIDGRAYSAYDLADIMYGLMLSQTAYSHSSFICVTLFFGSYVMASQYSNEKDNTKETKFSVRKHRCAVDARKNEMKELIYILMWHEQGHHIFTEDECLYTNCYITFNRSLFGDDIAKFDAVISYNGIPHVRSPRQKYIFYTMESADRFPVCKDIYDGFFNWTMTYKLDSDIGQSYFLIKNNNGEVVGPKRNMEWVTDMEEKIDEQLKKRLRNKTKAAAWFVSDCRARSGRDKFVRNLQKQLNKYNLTVDVYGKCGPLKCPKSQSDVCDAMLEKDYYFYMALENSFDEDYVTEKLLRAMQNNVVPIVYGGANYSRFLPPGSYIDGRAYSAYDLADIMYGLMLSQTAYSQYFRWKKYYTYHDADKSNSCILCEAMNNREKVETHSVHNHFRHWWNNNFNKVCDDGIFIIYIGVSRLNVKLNLRGLKAARSGS
ncbi:alpha-(1,3)-fucosyltransferase C-like [Pectinophora gossypiella]|uniref:alpha-(1,3)-fucosyltransferase C-like n=1 Tax=Pectinophora gossypiella TaxID=13191 RepID=UPI00214EF620|nr:alpha-(1,3)-fucosyltransferase C-like [Pectinophora gossypiella]